MAHFGLVYGAVDIRLTEEGEYYFLEVNTAGEFLFADHRSGCRSRTPSPAGLADPQPASRVT